ncbi:hypothetical protein Btru_050932 [Bulinus truncatus]|nr:hypothetical protein Btru_050932 [Bulinus truncatus]
MSVFHNASTCDNTSEFSSQLITGPYSKVILSAISVCLSLLSAFTVFTNVTVIAAVCYSHVKRDIRGKNQAVGKSGCNVKLLMASLAVGDAFIGGCVMPISVTPIISNGRWILPMGLCKYFALLDIFLCSVSIYHVMFMAVDRYLAICRPMFHRLLTVRSGFAMAGICWVVPLVIMTLNVVLDLASVRSVDCNKSYECTIAVTGILAYGGATVTIFLPFSVICVLYVCILCEVKHFHRRRSKTSAVKTVSIQKVAHHKPTQRKSVVIKRLWNQSNSGISGAASASDSGKYNTVAISHTNIDLARDSTQETSTTKITENENVSTNAKKSGTNGKSRPFLTIGLLVLSFAACWCPFAITSCLLAISNPLAISMQVFTLVSWLGLLNSTLNPLLFCFHKSMRRAVKKMLFSRPPPLPTEKA